MSLVVSPISKLVKEKQIALVCRDDEMADRIVGGLARPEWRIARYAVAPQWGRLPADLILVDSSNITKRSTSGQFFAVCDGPVLILGSENDFSFPMRDVRRLAGFVEKPLSTVSLSQQVQTVFDEPRRRSNEPEDAACFAGTRVLLAERNRVDRLVTRVLLERMGCEVDVVTSVERQGGYDLALLGCDARKTESFEAVERLRSMDEPGQRTPVVALTAGMAKEEWELCYECGMDDFVLKPISAKELKSCLERWRPMAAKD